MKKTLIALLISVVAVYAMPNNELSLVLLSKAAEKKAIVLATMELKGETKVKFGKLYDKYQKALMTHRVNELGVIADYAKDMENMTDENSNKLITKWLTAEEAGMVLKKEYIAKFKKIMPSADVIRYFQIENRIQLMNELQRASMIPLAAPAQ